MTKESLACTYTLQFDPAHHLIEVTAVFPLAGETSVDLMMPVWTPGSYMLREYARHVENVAASDAGSGAALPIKKVRKNRWHVETHGSLALRLSYRVYGREMTVRTNWVEEDFALVNGAPTFITRPDCLNLRHDVMMTLPAAWPHIVTALPPHTDAVATHFSAENFDELVDSPLLCGNPGIHTFEVSDKPHILACEGNGGIWDATRATQDLVKIIEQNTRLWGSLPYPRYVFMNLLTDGRGGLEHKNSSVLMASRWGARSRSDYVDWLGLASHEFFHVWNIKRLRPMELGPFDYENETPTRSLWVAEGFTAYYDDLLVHRAGLTTLKEYLERLSKSIEHLQAVPGRLLQTLGDASFDAWIKYYRRDENSDNTAVSYYVKGTVVGFLLDAKVRQHTDGARSLDDVMRQAYARFSGTRGYTEAEFRALACEVAEADLQPFFTRSIDSTDDLDYTEALAWYGLAFKRGDSKEDNTANHGANQPGWLGVSTRNDAGRLQVTEVLRDAPAYRAGLNVDDEIIAIDAYRVTPGKFAERLKHYPAGTRASILIGRRERLLRLEIVFGEEPGKTYQLIVDSQASETQKAHLKAWLRGL